MVQQSEQNRVPGTGRQTEAGQEVTAAAAFAAPQGQPPVGPETDLWVGRTSWKHFLGRIVLWVVVMVVVAVGLWLLAANVTWCSGRMAWGGFAAIVALSGAMVLGGVLIRVLGTKYRLTSQRLFIARGILSQTTDQTELIRVDDVRLFKTFFGRILGVGTITVLTTDASDREVKMEGISEPEKVAEAVRSRMRTLRGKSLFVENL